MRWLHERRPLLRRLPTVGIAVGEALVAISMRDDPLRITGVFRQPLDRSATGDRSDELAGAVAAARRVLRMPADTPAIVALDPAQSVLRIPLEAGWGATAVAARQDAALVAAVEGAGFRIERFDVVPAALARFAHASDQHRGVITAHDWSVTALRDALHASSTRLLSNQEWHSKPSSDLTTSPVLLDVGGIHIAHAVRRWLRAELDAAAIGAALRMYGHGPDLIVQPVEVPYAAATGVHRTVESF